MTATVMTSRSDIEAQYNDLHSYIQAVKEEIGQVLGDVRADESKNVGACGPGTSAYDNLHYLEAGQKHRAAAPRPLRLTNSDSATLSTFLSSSSQQRLGSLSHQDLVPGKKAPSGSSEASCVDGRSACSQLPGSENKPSWKPKNSELEKSQQKPQQKPHKAYTEQDLFPAVRSGREARSSGHPSSLTDPAIRSKKKQPEKSHPFQTSCSSYGRIHAHPLGGRCPLESYRSAKASLSGLSASPAHGVVLKEQNVNKRSRNFSRGKKYAHEHSCSLLEHHYQCPLSEGPHRAGADTKERWEFKPGNISHEKDSNASFPSVTDKDHKQKKHRSSDENKLGPNTENIDSEHSCGGMTDLQQLVDKDRNALLLGYVRLSSSFKHSDQTCPNKGPADPQNTHVSDAVIKDRNAHKKESKKSHNITLNAEKWKSVSQKGERNLKEASLAGEEPSVRSTDCVKKNSKTTEDSGPDFSVGQVLTRVGPTHFGTPALPGGQRDGAAKVYEEPEMHLQIDDQSSLPTDLSCRNFPQQQQRLNDPLTPNTLNASPPHPCTRHNLPHPSLDARIPKIPSPARDFWPEGDEEAKSALHHPEKRKLSLPLLSRSLPYASESEFHSLQEGEEKRPFSESGSLSQVCQPVGTASKSSVDENLNNVSSEGGSSQPTRPQHEDSLDRLLEQCVLDLNLTDSCLDKKDISSQPSPDTGISERCAQGVPDPPLNKKGDFQLKESPGSADPCMMCFASDCKHKDSCPGSDQKTRGSRSGSSSGHAVEPAQRRRADDQLDNAVEESSEASQDHQETVCPPHPDSHNAGSSFSTTDASTDDKGIVNARTSERNLSHNVSHESNCNENRIYGYIECIANPAGNATTATPCQDDDSSLVKEKSSNPRKVSRRSLKETAVQTSFDFDEKQAFSVPASKLLASDGLGEQPGLEKQDPTSECGLSKGRKPSRSKGREAHPSVSRSKSVHGTEVEDGGEKESSLNGSLRELSHLNIDVSQRLVDGEKQYVLEEGPQELQVLVNVSTPVLSRRKASRRAAHKDEGPESPTAPRGKSSTHPELGKDVHQNVSRKLGDVEESKSLKGEEALQKLLQAVLDGAKNTLHDTTQSEREDENPSLDSNENNDQPHLPMYARIRSHDGVSGRKTSTEKMKPTTSKGETTSPVSETIQEEPHIPRLNFGSQDDNLVAELEKSRDSLFLSPKLAHTWHGPSEKSHRPAPKMGVSPRMGIGKMTADLSVLFSGSETLKLPSSKFPVQSVLPPGGGGHTQTFPVISRTLLDALHKRYCSHQYSPQYKALFKTMIAGSGTPSAVTVEPTGPVTAHELQIAPPSPQLLQKLRKLNSDGESDTTSSVTDSVQSSPRTAHLDAPREREESPDVSPQLQEKLNHGNKDKHEAEIEAVEACKWLRAAGFPQYAQMFEDGQFPVELNVVEKDHDFLDRDSIQSLFRRLETLNRCAGMKIDTHPRKKVQADEEDEEDLCVLSDRWEYQKSVRRWSRKNIACDTETVPEEVEGVHRSGSHDSLLADQDSGSQTGDSPVLDTKMPHHAAVATDHQPPAGDAVDSQKTSSAISPRLRRAASERIKSAKNLWKKMENLKAKKARKFTTNRNIVEISGPVVTNQEIMQAKLQKLNCVDISPTSEQPSGPFHERLKLSVSTDDSSSQSADSAPLSPQSPISPELPGAPVSGGTHFAPVSAKPAGTDAQAVSRANATGPTPDRLSPIQASPLTKTHPMSQSLFSRRPPSSQSAHSDLGSAARGTVATTAATPADSGQSQSDSMHEYYSAHTQLLQNFASVNSPSSPVRRNNSDTNLMEIFLLPQDHKPGSFPRLLQNGYVETGFRGPAINTHTGSIRLGRDGASKGDRHKLAARGLPLRNLEPTNRVSVYDNMQHEEGKSGDQANRLALHHALVSTATKDSRNRSLSLDSSCDAKALTDAKTRQSHLVAAQTDSASGRDRSLHKRSTSSESSSSSSSTVQSTIPRSQSSESYSKAQRQVSSEAPASSDKPVPVTHSWSLDSHPRVRASGSDSVSSSSSRTASLASTSSTDTVQARDQLDMLLQILYDDIRDLDRSIHRSKSDSPQSDDASPPTFPLSPPASAPPTATTATKTTATKTATAKAQETPPSVLGVSFDLNSVSSNKEAIASPSSPSAAVDVSMEVEEAEGSSARTSSSSDGSDQEVALEENELSHDDSLDQIQTLPRERRDSGVGLSLKRSNGEKKHKKIRWHSFQNSHRPSVDMRAMQINALTVGQLLRLQKLSLLKLTGIMDQCLPVNRSGWNWMMPKFMKRNKSPDFSEKTVFGVPLSVIAQRTGQPLPQCILYAMRYLRHAARDAVGIFRKPGVKSRIQKLREELEAHPDTTEFDQLQAFDVADMLKTYFRDLPDCLLTSKLAETFRSICTHVPENQRVEAMQAAIMLMPDEHREVLQSLLLFLSDISQYCKYNQMNVENLAVCFAPTLFNIGGRYTPSTASPKRHRKNTSYPSGSPEVQDFLEQNPGECTKLLITECKKLFTVPAQLFRQLQVQSVAVMEPPPFEEFSTQEGEPSPEVRSFGQDRIQTVLKEAHDKNRGWVSVMTISNIEISNRKPQDENPLKEWKLVVEIEAPPIEVLNRIMHERHVWDEDLLSWSVVERLGQHADIFQYTLNSMAPHPVRNFCVLRYWRSDLTKGACALVTMSVDHSEAPEVQGVLAADLGSYFLMEPCGSGRCRLTHITRTDIRGRLPEWYNKIFSHIAASFIERLRDSFRQELHGGPETKV